MPNAVPQRALLGFLAAAIAVLTFHQGMILFLRSTGQLGIPATAAVWNMSPNPFGVPQILNLCFWGGLYGVVFGIFAPRFRLPMWFCGFLAGFAAVLVGFFVVAAIKGNPIGGGWVPLAWARSIAINGFFGIGLGLIYPRLARIFLKA
jgi:hypothetical protein